MKRTTVWARILKLPVFLSLVLFASVCKAGLVFDDFRADSQLWFSWANKEDSILYEGGRLKFVFPDNSYNTAYISSMCNLEGDYDIEVEYFLLGWPTHGVGNWFGNGASIELLTRHGSIARSSIPKSEGDNPCEVGGEIFEAQFGYKKICAYADDVAGKLRLVKTGEMLKAYAWQGESWNLIGAKPAASSSDWTGFSVALRRDYARDPAVPITVAIDNLIINKGNGNCIPPILVEKMQPKSTPTIKLLNPKNEIIQNRSMDFVPEVMTPEIRDPERVVFKRASAPSENEECFFKGRDASTGKVVYKSKSAVWPARKKWIAVVWEKDDIRPPPPVGMVEKIRWSMTCGSEKQPDQVVAKRLYSIFRKPIKPATTTFHTRWGIMDIACDLARGATNGSEARGKLEVGLFKKYFNRTYASPIHFSDRSGVFNLSSFWNDSRADCNDMAIMHKITCNAIGLKQVLGTVNSENAKKIVRFAPRSQDITGQVYLPGKLSFEGYHRVSVIEQKDSTRRIWDAFARFDETEDGEAPPEAFTFSAGRSRDDYEGLIVGPVSWAGCVIWSIK